MAGPQESVTELIWPPACRQANLVLLCFALGHDFGFHTAIHLHDPGSAAHACNKSGCIDCYLLREGQGRAGPPMHCTHTEALQKGIKMLVLSLEQNGFFDLCIRHELARITYLFPDAMHQSLMAGLGIFCKKTSADTACTACQQQQQHFETLSKYRGMSYLSDKIEWTCII